MRALILACFPFLLAGCTENSPFRDVSSTCEYSGAVLRQDNDCGASTMEHHTWHPDQALSPVSYPDITRSYTLAYAEFDGEGKPYDPAQQRIMFDQLVAESRTQDISIVVFVHGWKHNAAPGDDNVKDFRRLLAAVAELEAQKPPADRRRVFGVYTGWRGLSSTTPVLWNLSFWERKDAAHRVSEGGIRGLLGKLRAFRDTIALQAPLPRSDHPRETRLLTIGHSFGALVVWSALSLAWCRDQGCGRADPNAV